jgi:hypothetical protein
VVRHVGHDDALAEQHGALDEQRRLVVEQMLPPARGMNSGRMIVT